MLIEKKKWDYLADIRARTGAKTLYINSTPKGIYQFDLGLPNFKGKTYHGNCDLCFLKGYPQTLSLIQEKPERAVWWAKMEAKIQSSGEFSGDGARFRKDRPSYASMMQFAKDQGDMFGSDEDSISCFCGD